jgi:hypothetical protein
MLTRIVVFVALPLAGCSGSANELPAVKQVRSAAAEWAIINREAARGRLTTGYTTGMRNAAREEIQNAAKQLSASPNPASGHAAALLALPDNATPDQLDDHIRALKQVETRLEAS